MCLITERRYDATDRSALERMRKERVEWVEEEDSLVSVH